jgi:hypothetical protein
MAKKKSKLVAFEPYQAKIKTFLNVRSDAGLEYEKIDTIPSKSVTILEEKDGWGRIENGWINISTNFVERIDK